MLQYLTDNTAFLNLVNDFDLITYTYIYIYVCIYSNGSTNDILMKKLLEDNEKN